MISRDTRVPKPAAFLGFFGAVPFVAGAVLIWLVPSSQATIPLLGQSFYAAVILSFMGGVRWGLAMVGELPSRFGPLALSVTPALMAWAALLVLMLLPGAGAPVALVLMILGFAGLLWSDLRASRAGVAPAWYPNLRIPLTLIVVGSLLASLARMVLPLL
ncbi:MAG: DUF3429 domain-containing protein [Alphaproteobacteria bacterium]